jgi:hypothetical protein
MENLEMTMLRHVFLAFILSVSLLVPTAFAAPVPVAGDAPVPVDGLRLANAAVLPMTGTWRFKLDHGKSPAVKGELPADSSIPAIAALDASDADRKNRSKTNKAPRCVPVKPWQKRLSSGHAQSTLTQ